MLKKNQIKVIQWKLSADNYQAALRRNKLARRKKGIFDDKEQVTVVYEHGCPMCESGMMQNEHWFCKQYLESKNVDLNQKIPEGFALGDFVIENGCPFFRRCQK